MIRRETKSLFTPCGAFDYGVRYGIASPSVEASATWSGSAVRGIGQAAPNQSS